MTGYLPIALSIGAGLGVGFAYYWALKLNAAIYLGGGAKWRGVALHVLRTAAAVAFFWFLARMGAGPLLSGFGGFLMSRFWVTRLVRREVP